MRWRRLLNGIGYAVGFVGTIALIILAFMVVATVLVRTISIVVAA